MGDWTDFVSYVVCIVKKDTRTCTYGNFAVSANFKKKTLHHLGRKKSKPEPRRDDEKKSSTNSYIGYEHIQFDENIDFKRRIGGEAFSSPSSS